MVGTRSELNCTPEKTGGKNEGRFVFFLREFFSCAVLSERLEQATFQLSN